VTLVVDASMVVAGLTDSGADGRWAESLLAGDSLAAPHLMPVEVANILRRAALAGDTRQSVRRKDSSAFSSVTSICAFCSDPGVVPVHRLPASELVEDPDARLA
jgi:predicted nucleic acid-binding protein